MGWGRVVVPAAGFAMCVSALRAQPPTSGSAGQTNLPTVDSSGPIATIRTTVRQVVLDVVVNDNHGQPVKGLEASNFTLSEDGVPQTLASFTEHDAATDLAQSAVEDELPPNTFTVQPPERGHGAMTVIVLGEMGFGDAPYVRYELNEYLKTATPSMPIAIFRVDREGMHLVQGFTADLKILKEAVASKRILPPLGFAPTGHIVKRGTLQLSRYLSSIPGRINVIWFGSGSGGAQPSAGLGPENAFSDVSSFVRDLNGTRNILRLSRVALYPVDAGGLTGVDLGFESGTWPPPPPDSAAMFASGGIADMAAATGGRAFINTNGFKEAIAQVVDTGSHYYTVSYSPTNHDWNGAYRRIALNVTGIPEVPNKFSWSNLYDSLLGWTDFGPKVLYRPGYYARDTGPEPPPLLAVGDVVAGNSPGSERKVISVSRKGDPNGWGHSIRDPMKRAMEFASPTPIDMPFKIAVTPMPEVDKVKGNAPLPKDNFLVADWRGTPYRNYRVHYLLSPEDLQFTVSADGVYHDSFRFVMLIFRDDGEAVNSIATMVPVTLKAGDYERVMQTGMSFEQTIAIPTRGNSTAFATTGDFFVRAGVEEVDSGRIGAIEVPAEWVRALPANAPGGTTQAAR